MRTRLSQLKLMIDLQIPCCFTSSRTLATASNPTWKGVLISVQLQIARGWYFTGLPLTRGCLVDARPTTDTRRVAHHDVARLRMR